MSEYNAAINDFAKITKSKIKNLGSFFLLISVSFILSAKCEANSFYPIIFVGQTTQPLQEEKDIKQEVVQGNSAEAVQDLDKVIASEPNNAKAFFNRGSVFMLEQQYQKALEDFKQSERLASEQGNIELKDLATKQIELIQKLESK
jgi:tetratricopeptide (TPR) repeat protein